MSSRSEYLEMARREEVIEELERKGYTVQRDVPLEGHHIDLVAQKGDERIAYEFKARGLAPHARITAVKQLSILRRIADQHGFTGFRVVVVSAPRTSAIHVAELEDRLVAALAGRLPEGLPIGVEEARVVDVEDVQVDRLDLTADGADAEVRGTVVLEFRPADADDGRARVTWGFPFRADVVLSRDLREVSLSSLSVLDNYFHFAVAETADEA